jgi:MFS transporter, ACS family, D-galactonate transporter
MGFVAPGVTGVIIGATNSFANAFIAAGGILLIGISCYLFLFGRIEPIPEPAA